jgi:hypothetical protein
MVDDKLKFTRKIRCFLGLCCLIGCIVVWWVYQANSDQGLRPESVVNMFAEAGYEVSELQAVATYPGPLTNRDRPINNGGKFSVRVADSIVEVYVVCYSNNSDGAYVTRQINALNKRMNGGYAYAYHRGTVVLSIGTFDSNIAQELGRVFLEN